jgi:hypothetical protein
VHVHFSHSNTYLLRISTYQGRCRPSTRILRQEQGSQPTRQTKRHYTLFPCLPFATTQKPEQTTCLLSSCWKKDQKHPPQSNDNMVLYEAYNGYFYFTNAQYLSLVTAGIFSCLLSLFGSCTIIFLILQSEHRTGEVYHRLVFGMSISDLFFTSGLLLQPFLMPSETGFPFAIGNQTTCNIMGFIAPFFVTSYCYSSFLGVYFMMMVRYNRKQKDLARLLEPWVHILAWGFPLVYAITVVSLQLINPNPYLGICNTIPYPIECTFLDDVECVRAEMATFIVPVHDAISLLYVVISLVSTWLVYWTVRKQSRTMTRYNVDGTINENQRKRERAVAIQAVCLSGAYLIGFNTIVSVELLKGIYSPKLSGIGDLEDYPFFFVAEFLIWLLFPLQGFVNCLIYIRPRYQRWRNYFPEKSWLWSFRMVVTGQTAPPGGWNTPALSTRFNPSSRDIHQSSAPTNRPGMDSRRSTNTSFNGRSISTSLNDSNVSSIVVEEPNKSEKVDADLQVKTSTTTSSMLSSLPLSTLSEGPSMADEHAMDENKCNLRENINQAIKYNSEIEAVTASQATSYRIEGNESNIDDRRSQSLESNNRAEIATSETGHNSPLAGGGTEYILGTNAKQSSPKLNSPGKISNLRYSRIGFDGSIS